ncbi:MAG: hypothetical protein ACM3O6_02390 [Acidobacteriota bacterium]
MNRSNRRLLQLGLCMILVPLFDACAVQSSLTTQKGADVSVMSPGAERADVERAVGAPLKEWTTSDGVRYRLYEYSGDAGPNAGAVALFVGLDIATLGILEVASPNWSRLAASDRRPRRRVAVAYDRDDRVIGVFPNATEFDALPDDGKSTSPIRE